ncbi:hypothetical protein [Nannocystis pusilla]|uniref:hypothetical protein n=1 Tax=Nannocystis pusilla TaxID=889268 RepID=UPI003B7BEE37
MLVGSSPVVTSVVGAGSVVVPGVPVLVRSPLEVVPVVAFGSVVEVVDEVVAASVPPEPPPQARANEQASAQVTTSRRSIPAFYKAAPAIRRRARAPDRRSRGSLRPNVRR